MLLPPGEEMLADITRLKGDERVFGYMLHGVRTAERARQELEDDIAFWQVRGYGTWCVFLRGSGDFLGICGFMERPDGRGVALRYALWPECRGRGYAREAARAALDFGHRAGLERIIGVARESNAQSIEVMTDIGMHLADSFQHQEHRMLVFASRRSAAQG